MSKQRQAQRQRSPRVERKREQAKLEILQVAQDILAESGIEGVTLASVAGELGMTKQALYHYFSSKEALIRSLVTMLLDDEVTALSAAVEGAPSAEKALGIMIRAFYEHYIPRLNAFRAIYCQSQLYTESNLAMDKTTVEKEINPRTRHLFDTLESRISDGSTDRANRKRMRLLAFTAWCSALGALTMLSIADAVDDPLVHSDNDLLNTLSEVFDNATIR